jgi:DNA-binding MarR family transcriptional regulator
MGEHRDHVAEIIDAWHREKPELDLSPVGIFGRITRIEHHQTAALRDMHRRYNLDPGEYDVLAALRRSGPDYRLTPTELYRSMLVTSATMTERLDRLQRKKLIRRRPAPHDRRSTLVELTAQGRKVIDRAHVDLLETESALLEGLTPQERSGLADLLAKLAALLE